MHYTLNASLVATSYRSFTAILVWKCLVCLPTHLLAIIFCCSYIYISQGSVATQLRCGEIFEIFDNPFDHCQLSSPQSTPVKNFENRLIFGEDVEMTVWRFFGIGTVFISGKISMTCFNIRHRTEHKYDGQTGEQMLSPQEVAYCTFRQHRAVKWSQSYIWEFRRNCNVACSTDN